MLPTEKGRRICGRYDREDIIKGKSYWQESVSSSEGRTLENDYETAANPKSGFLSELYWLAATAVRVFMANLVFFSPFAKADHDHSNGMV